MRAGFLRIAYLFCLLSLPGFAGSWSGWLVDSKCYRSIETNRGDIPSYVNWDVSGAIRYCSPNHKTMSFAIVQQDQSYFKLDPRGSLRAAELLTNSPHKALYLGTVRGNLNRHVITVEAISVARWSRR